MHFVNSSICYPDSMQACNRELVLYGSSGRKTPAFPCLWEIEHPTAVWFEIDGGLAHCTRDDLFLLAWSLYLPHITDSDKAALESNERYLRFLYFQDRFDSKVYMWAYCRDMANMLPDQKAKAKRCLEEAHGVLCEVGYTFYPMREGSRAYFYVRH